MSVKQTKKHLGVHFPSLIMALIIKYPFINSGTIIYLSCHVSYHVSDPGLDARENKMAIITETKQNSQVTETAW